MLRKFGKGELWAIGASISYALTNVALKWAVAEAPPLFGASLKIIPVWILAVVILFFKGLFPYLDPKSVNFLGFKNIGLCVLTGALVYVLGNGSLFEAFKRGGVIIVSPITGTQVIWTALISNIFLGEKVSMPMIAGMIISICGITLLAAAKAGNEVLTSGWFLAVPLSLTAALCYASGNAIQRHLLRKQGIDKWVVMFLSLTAGQVLLHLIFLVNGMIVCYTALPLSAINKFLFAGLFEASAIICLTSAVGLTEAASASAINSTNTALAPLLAWILLEENLTFTMMAGILIAMVGILAVQIFKPQEGKNPVKGG